MIQRRFAKAKDEMSRARSSGAYDVFLVNEELEAAKGRAIEIVRAEQARRGYAVIQAGVGGSQPQHRA